MTEISRLKSIVETLRSENGCSWDKVQTHSSLKAACIEEAAEVVGGIVSQRPSNFNFAVTARQMASAISSTLHLKSFAFI